MIDPLFSGSTYDADADEARLRQQLARVRLVMSDAHWHTLGEIEHDTGDPQASISARLRDLRKDRFGGWTVERRIRGERHRGLHEYRVRGLPKPSRTTSTRRPGAPRETPPTHEGPSRAERLLTAKVLRRVARLTESASLRTTLTTVSRWLTTGTRPGSALRRDEP